jgi:hypothetical protein
VKFIVLTGDPSTAIFQDSNLYAFHYDFAVNELPAFAGMTPQQFDAVTLYDQNQQAVLGAVLFPPTVGYNHVIQEYGIQLVRRDAYAATEVRDLFNLVKSKVIADPGVQPYYFPTVEQQSSAEQNAAFLAAEGIIISSTARWADGNACYATGWALGELKYFEGPQIEGAYLAGALDGDDILLTDAVPAEIPAVAGVMSLSPSTPNSHVAILAETFDLPFAHLALAEDAQRAQELVGERMVLRVEDEAGACRVRLIEVEGVLDPPTIDSILALKAPQPLDITPLARYGGYSQNTDLLTPPDIRFFGGKAANFGHLRRAIPASSPVAVAFSFDLWTEFIDQTLANDKTLRQEIADRLAPYGYPPNVASLSAALLGVQDLFKDDNQTSFSPEAESAVLGVLQEGQYGFDASAKIKFRSSTNMEDGDRFTGAGLYDSFSGCLADELDADDLGPSICDPTENNERGVFRAIRKVFASFYNLNATIERLRYSIDENQVGMAILAHHSFPDAIELANGVGTLDRPPGQSRTGLLVTQAGASSVTNPEPGAVPEEVSYFVVGSTVYPTLESHSNLVQLGAAVMDFPTEYVALVDLLTAVAVEFEQSTGLGDFTLEFEYKKTAPDDDLVVKQIRQIPEDDTVPSVTPFLINEPADYCLYQGEWGDVFGNHRLKSAWMLSTESLWLTVDNLQTSFFADTTLEYTEVCQLYDQSGSLLQWPQASHAFASGTATDGWVFDALQNPRSHTLSTSDVPTLVAPADSPLLVLSDFGPDFWADGTGCLSLAVDYEIPVPTIDHDGPTMTTTDWALYCRCPSPRVGDLLQERRLSGPGGVVIDTGFYWPPPLDLVAGYTAPLSRWVQTTISGLTTEPIVLTGDYSQTYRPGHHNISEAFLFEPLLEPGLSRQQLDELQAAGVRTIHVDTGPGPEPAFTYYDDLAWGDACLGCAGFDGDRDGYCTGDPTYDCDDDAPEVWSRPGEVRDLTLLDHDTFGWSEPSDLGGASVLYDTLRADEPADHVTAPVCVESDDGADLMASDVEQPAVGSVFYYLVRAQNACPDGEGPAGYDSTGAEHPAGSCP